MVFDHASNTFNQTYQIDVGYLIYASLINGNFIHLAGKKSTYAFDLRTTLLEVIFILNFFILILCYYYLIIMCYNTFIMLNFNEIK
jgi:ABC-type multidrug transport system permease subunit